MCNQSNKATLKIAKAAMFFIATMFATHAFAWGGVVSGKITAISLFGAGNLPFRVYLEGAPVLCTGGMAEGYTIFSDVGLFGRCRIGSLTVN